MEWEGSYEVNEIFFPILADTGVLAYLGIPIGRLANSLFRVFICFLEGPMACDLI